MFDGDNWSVMTSNSDAPLRAIWGSATDDVFAVSSDGAILRFNGASWGGVPSGTEARLDSVWGLGPSDVYAVGEDGTILRFDGESWSPMESGVDDSALRDIVGFSASELVVIYSGGFLLGNGIGWRPEPLEIGHYDFNTWTPLVTTGRETIEQILALGPREAFARTRDRIFHLRVPD